MLKNVLGKDSFLGFVSVLNFIGKVRFNQA